METKLISVVLPEETYKKIKRYCLDNNVTIKSFIHASLVMSLKEIDNAKKSAKR